MAVVVPVEPGTLGKTGHYWLLAERVDWVVGHPGVDLAAYRSW